MYAFDTKYSTACFRHFWAKMKLFDLFDLVLCSQGCCAEDTARKFNIGREAQDEFAINSYKKSQASGKSGVFAKEIVPVTVPKKKGMCVVIVVWESLAMSKFSSERYIPESMF